MNLHSSKQDTNDRFFSSFAQANSQTDTIFNKFYILTLLRKPKCSPFVLSKMLVL